MSKRAFVLHFAEMVLAMLVGMGVFAGLAALAFAAAGSSLADQPGALRVMLMGLSMTIPMVGWMSYRGHSAGRNAEMAASMMVPTAGAAALAAAGVLEAGAALAIQHAVMVPAMLAVMLWRYGEYARPHRASAALRSRRSRTSNQHRDSQPETRRTHHAHASDRLPQEWEAARRQLLVNEKELMRARDALAAARRRMPWQAIEKDYRFEGPNGPASLIDLFERLRRRLRCRRVARPQRLHPRRRTDLPHLLHGRGDEGTATTWSYLDMTALGRHEAWEESPEGYPQTPPYVWWKWHDAYDADTSQEHLEQTARALAARESST